MEVDGEDVENEQALEALFRRLDRDSSGSIDIREFQEALRALGRMFSPINDSALILSLPSSDAQALLDMMDTNKDGRISFAEFLEFMHQRESKVRALFDALDRNHDRYLSKSELKEALENLNMHAEDRALERLIHHIDRDGNGVIDFREFRSFLALLPTLNIHSVFEQWMEATSFDMTEDVVTPQKANQAKSQTLSPLHLLTAGGLAGAISRTVTAPLDRLKMMYQAGTIPHGTSLLQACRNILQEGGWMGFYRGNGTNVIKIAPETAVKFWAFENLRIAISRGTDTTIVERFVAGALAGSLAQALIYPLEITKTRLGIAPKGEYRGIFHCLSRIVRYEGIRAMYRGLVPAISGIIPYAGTDLAVFSLLKDTYTRRYPDSPPDALTLLACGAISSSMGQLVAYPLVVVRTRLQAQGMRGHPIKYTGMVDCFRQLIATEGVRALYRGIMPNFLKAVPAISISYVVYERAKQWLQ